MIDISKVALDVHRDSAGYWTARTDEKISYPDDGSAACFAIEDDSFWFRHRNRVIVDIAKRYPPSGVVLDVGGGNGYVAKALESAGYPTVLIEPNRTGAANALRRGVEHVICATTDAAGIVEESFGGIGLFDVIEHIENDVSFLKALVPYVKPGGRFYISVPAYQSLWSVDDVSAGHFRRYTVRSLCNSLQAAGLNVEFASYFFSVLPLPILLLRSLPSRLGLRREVSNDVVAHEHSSKRGTASWVIDKVLDAEFNRLRSGATLPFGTSCIAVARMPS